jgi:hypothetical protein
MTDKQQYDNTNRGVLFRETDKEKETDRDYSGSINVDGREFWLSGWINQSKRSGRKFLSLTIKPKDAPQPEKPKPKESTAAPFDDAIAF